MGESVEHEYTTRAPGPGPMECLFTQVLSDRRTVTYPTDFHDAVFFATAAT